MPGSLLGTEVRRVEDPELLRGRGSYVGNLPIEGALHMAFVRSPFAHALITAIDTTEAAKAPGVVAVYTAEDLGLPPLVPFIELNPHCARHPLASDRVRFVGEPVVAVVAESPTAAVDAMELVDVDYEPLPAAIDPEEALAPDAPTQFPELGTNIAAGNRDADDDVFAEAEVVVRARIENQRLAVAPMEGNAIAVLPGDDEFDATIYVSTQMPHGFRNGVSKMFGWPVERIRVVAPHVGGGFGGKAGATAEHAVVIEASRRLGRPVRWAETRSENLQSMPHGRAQVQYGELGLRSDGKIVGLRCRVIGDAGAYGGFGGALALGPTRTMAQGVYDIPKISYAGIAALTNTTPVGAFRGAGRPEAAAMLERLMDLAAAELDLDPAELRRRNFLKPEQFPYTTLTGASYDSGDYDLPLREALRLAGYEDLRAEQARRIEAGETVLLGIGVAAYVEITGGGAGEFASVEIDTEGGATIKVGTSGHGQGHPTAFSMIVADALGLPLERVKFVQSDTATVPRGGGTGGSRSLQLGGSAVRQASDLVLRRAKELAATKLEAAVEDVVLTDDGTLGVRGVPTATITWADVATAAHDDGRPLVEETDFKPDGATFPFGAHVSVVEVDTETGYVKPLRHVAVDDCGRVLNPLLVRGQQHGGAVQGISQALWEQISFDEDGNPVTASFAEYLVPSAADVPDLEVANTETTTPRNLMGAKGIGESATVGSTPAVQNAVIDAVKHLGVRHIDIPATPQRVWRAIQAAKAGSPEDPWREPPAAFEGLPVRESAKSEDADEAVA
ncbi:carbon-monoxide dehydrogenase large subunit [Amycolatopsis bartoniae]|uniref:Carbon-monoxide dehydrogenase large subunit n=1 Tax=Amycolatopsis bartoniae TaxID=941986 RepID=A0A8H9J0F2_9PSEU|nr:xanthine dehydrogenase family protein molybdopterin-binding subunit [Amycolatopsis bartoniae]MBB2935004.1 carbon-monoxide dehydrogenase large subunit [Amycolatopsis bartoniae]TVT00837.1 xanthine dehydrogenase family protein molybdopterin-binding subunit [Amycolatopsis bartoniae]GHF73644.1 carbon-monoxide dehydrogenase large subunit [Amycolatopsis bartoniae]